MSIWNHSTVAACVAHILRSEFYIRAMAECEGKAEPVSARLWDGIDNLRHRFHIEHDGLLIQMLKSEQDIRDPKKIEQLHDYEVRAAFLSDLYYLTADNPKTVRHAERRVQNVINGNLPVLQGTTISMQLKRMAEHSEIRAKPKKERVGVTNDMH